MESQTRALQQEVDLEKRKAPGAEYVAFSQPTKN